MFNMLNQFFSMFASLFSAGNKFASALDVMAGVTETAAKTYADEVANKRSLQAITLAKELKLAEQGKATAPKAIAAT
jgi:hypothetical protein